MIHKESWYKESSLPKTLYHSTPKRFLPLIQEKGLSPKASKSSLRAVFLTDDPYTAKNYTLGYDEPAILLAVDTSALDLTELGPDNVEFQDYIEDQSRYNDFWKDRNWDEFTWKDSLEAVSQVAYYKTIPPNAIRVVRGIL